MPLKISSLQINLPFGIGGMNIEIDEGQRQAAWALYVELATRIASVELEPGMGSPREALNSLYSLFGMTRTVLREAGPGAAKGPESVGPIAIDVLNKGLRPFVVKWHTKLTQFEQSQSEGKAQTDTNNAAPSEDQFGWPDSDEFYKEIKELQANMFAYVEALAHIAGVSKT